MCAARNNPILFRLWVSIPFSPRAGWVLSRGTNSSFRGVKAPEIKALRLPIFFRRYHGALSRQPWQYER